MQLFWNNRSSGKVFLFALFSVFSSLVVLSGCNSQGGVVADSIIEGTILTMDADNSIAEAVAIDARGVILGVGTASAIRNQFYGIGTRVQVLGAKESLMPGLIEPHTHLLEWLQYNGVTVLSPCYPGPYAAGNEPRCSNYIKTSLQTLKPATCSAAGGILFGLNLDPSRQPYDTTTPAATFRRNPAQYIDADVCANQPVLIIDQSGHFGYVNKAAFDGLQNWSQAQNPPLPWPPKMPSDAVWPLDTNSQNASDNSKYSGLLIEQDAFVPFMEWLGATDPGFIGQMLRDPSAVVNAKAAPVLKGLNLLRAAGVTTVTSIADSKGEINGIAAVAGLAGSPIRTITNTRPPALNNAAPPPTRAACDPRTDGNCTLPLYLGVTGIKLTADGSTQGCTAAMLPSAPYSANGPCAKDALGNDNALGRADYENAGEIADFFRPYWSTGQWRLESHANGSRAIKMVLDAYAQLQAERPIARRVTIVHATVGVESVWQQLADMRAGKYMLNGKVVPALDIRLTHLIGHVPYWGGAMESILTPELAKNVDPLVTLDIAKGIPFTLHSDTMVSLPFPMWFVQQAVTRDTWYYPEIRDADRKVLGPENRISVREALRAVTISVAQEKEVDGWLGSIEPGKVADFVRLSDNPLNYDSARGGDPRKIVDIKILDTYLNGKPTAVLK